MAVNKTYSETLKLSSLDLCNLCVVTSRGLTIESVELSYIQAS